MGGIASIETSGTLHRLLLSLCAEDPEIYGIADTDAVLDRVHLRVFGLPPPFRLAFNMIVLLFEYTPSLTVGGWGRFSRLPLDARLRKIKAWECSRFVLKRNLFRLLKMILMTSLMQDRALLDAVGYSDTLYRRANHAVEPAEGGVSCRLGERP
jgi:hypothetical protein